MSTDLIKIHELIKNSNAATSPALLRKLLQKKIEADILGQYSSRRKGQGLQFSDLREYLPGDDVKNIHWSASARTNKIQVKNYEEEKILNVVCLIDSSPSMDFGFKESQYSKALEFFCQIGLLCLKNNDAVGLGLFNKDLHGYYPPKQGKKYFLNLLQTLFVTEQPKVSDLKTAIYSFRMQHKKRSLCFLISDFFASNYEQELRLLANQHDLIVIFMASNPEKNIPNCGLLRYRCAETGKESIIDSSNAAIKKIMHESEIKRYKKLETLCRSAGARSIYVENSIIEEL